MESRDVAVTSPCPRFGATLVDVTTEVDPDPTIDGGADDAGSSDDDFIVLPWWQNPINIISMLLGVLLLAGGAGFVIGERHEALHPTTSDIGFLQDMRAHHEQAVEMSLIYIAKTDTDNVIETIAREIAFDQAVEIGKMIQLLRDYGKPEANESGTAMSWMGEPTPLDRMPGLATEADVQSLIDAKGAAADKIFLTLMIAHHQGGLHMLNGAVKTTGTSEMKLLVEGMISGQRSEIAEMTGLLAKLPK